MSKSEKAAGSQHVVVYEVRALTDRWLDPKAGPVVSSHSSAAEAWAAFKREPQEATDGTGRSTKGNYVAKAVVRVDEQGEESMILAPPAGGGLLAWPYSN